jgi:hypothetical protein
MPFVCSICEEESTRICVLCTKDTCSNHLCEKCGCCSDCCDCEIPLVESTNGAIYREPIRPEPIHAEPIHPEPLYAQPVHTASPPPDPEPEPQPPHPPPDPDPFPGEEPQNPAGPVNET